MAGKMAVGTAFIPELWEEPQQEERRRAEPSALKSVAAIAVIALIVVAFAVRIFGWIDAHGYYNRACARSAELSSESTALKVKLDGLSDERRIMDMANALGMREPDPSMVKTVTAKP